jgi:hypothetical protein
MDRIENHAVPRTVQGIASLEERVNHQLAIRRRQGL